MLRHHWPYIFSMVFFLILLVVIFPLQINKYLELRQNVINEQQEITRINNELSKIDSYQGVNLDEDIKVLQTVYPDNPDRFSLFKNISLLQNNNLQIQNFSSPFSDDNDEKLGINVRSIANIEGFTDLLSNYFFKTGKLATIDTIFYDLTSQDLNFTLYFHSKSIEKGSGFLTKMDNNFFAQIQDIRKVIATLSLTPDSANAFTNNSGDDYSAKTNPFQNTTQDFSLIPTPTP